MNSLGNVTKTHAKILLLSRMHVGASKVSPASDDVQFKVQLYSVYFRYISVLVVQEKRIHIHTPFLVLDVNSSWSNPANRRRASLRDEKGAFWEHPGSAEQWAEQLQFASYLKPRQVLLTLAP